MTTPSSVSTAHSNTGVCYCPACDPHHYNAFAHMAKHGELPSSVSTRDWPEDFTHENGAYQNSCIHCGEIFIGHKRRVICKRCSVSTSERGKHSAMIAALTPPFPTPASLPEALDRFHIACQKINLAFHLIHNHVTGMTLSREYSKAHSEVISLFDAQQAENERLRGECSGWSDIADSQTAELSSQQARIEELERQIERRWANGGLPQDVETLRAELALLRETALTPGEAEGLRWCLEDVWPISEVRRYFGSSAFKTLHTKLSRLATQDQDSKA